MVDPVLVGGAVAAAGVVVAAAYAYLSGDDASAGVDVDGDGEDDVSYTFEGNDSEQESTFGISGGSAEPSVESSSSEADEVEAGGTSMDSTTFEAAPDEVRDIGTDLAQVTGIGDTRADDLKKAGFHNASDLYFASDEELTEVSGIGDLTVSQIRGDIGGVDEGNDGESSDSTDTDSSSETESEQSSPDVTDGDGSSSADE